MSAPRIPASPSDVTADWLTAALRRTGHLPEAAAVAGIEMEPIGVGVGVLGDLARLHLTYDGPAHGAPPTVIAKCPTLAAENRQVGLFMRFYEREVRFYREVAPRVSLRVPRCYGAEMDLDTGEFLLLIEDLSDLTVGDQVAGASIDQAHTALGALADFHALWWNSPDLDDDGALGWIPTGDSPITLGAGQLYRQYWAGFEANYAERIGPDALALGRAVHDQWEELITAATGRPWTIAHTDFRLDNLLFGPNQFAVIDWQLMLRANGIFDVAYFINGSLPVDERRAHERDLFDGYLAALAARGVAVDRDDLWHRYRQATLVQLVYAVTVGGALELGNERGQALSDALVDRYFAAALDHGAGLLA